MDARRWRERRASLTHDWLRNRLLPRLGACIAIARGEAGVSDGVVADLLLPLRDWAVRGPEVLRLVEEFCDVMSPQPAVAAVGLVVSSDVASYLRRTTLEAWMLRHHVAELLDDVRAAHGEVERSYAALGAGSSEPMPDECALAALAQSCERLARSLSTLPDDRVF